MDFQLIMGCRAFCSKVFRQELELKRENAASLSSITYHLSTPSGLPLLSSVQSMLALSKFRQAKTSLEKEEKASQGPSPLCNSRTISSKGQKGGEKKNQQQINQNPGPKNQGSTSFQLLLTRKSPTSEPGDSKHEIRYITGALTNSYDDLRVVKARQGMVSKLRPSTSHRSLEQWLWEQSRRVQNPTSATYMVSVLFPPV